MITTIKLRKLKRIFGWTFLVSSVFLVSVVFIGALLFAPKAEMISPEITKQNEAKSAGSGDRGINAPQVKTFSSPSLLNLPVLISIISLLTSLTSLIGFLSTTVLAWRKEKREALATELDMKKKLIEIEKLREELKTKGQGS